MQTVFGTNKQTYIYKKSSSCIRQPASMQATKHTKHVRKHSVLPYDIVNY